MFLVTPVLVSGNIKENLASISFLGSILNRVIVVSEKPASLKKDYFIQNIERTRSDYSRGVRLTSPDIGSKYSIPQSDKEEFVSSENKTSSFKLHYKKISRPKIEFKDALVDGEFNNRVVLYKPDLPEMFLFGSDFRLNYKVTVSFGISRHGYVENPECLVSSGSSEMDQMAMRYVRRWQFIPVKEDAHEAEKGILRIVFK